MPSSTPFAELDWPYPIFLGRKTADSMDLASGEYSPSDYNWEAIDGHPADTDPERQDARTPSGRLSSGEIEFFTEAVAEEGDLIELHFDDSGTGQGTGNFITYRIVDRERRHGIISKFEGTVRNQYSLEKQEPED